MKKNATRQTGQTSKGATTLVVEQHADETDGAALARTLMQPYVRHAIAMSGFTESLLPRGEGKPALQEYADIVKNGAAKAESGDTSLASRMLATQALTLDSMFTEYSRRAALNMGEYMDAAERYARLALKAQANSRATLEALAKLHQPREQIVRHVHVNEGGQAIVADQFHNHRGDGKNEVSIKQSYAPCKSSKTAGCAALSRPHPEREAVSIASGEREAAMPDARRD